MNENLMIIIVGIVIIILIIIYLNKGGTEHLTTQSDEAIKNIASLYNKDELTISKLNVVDTFNLLPKGIIVAWSGGGVAPAGWAICDGTNGTPNLKDRFILGGPNYGETGGAFQYTLSAAQIPSHSHTFTNTGDDNGYCSKDNNRPCGLQTSDNTTNDRQTTFSTDPVGGNQPYSVVPPYYRLAYIMRL